MPDQAQEQVILKEVDLVWVSPVQGLDTTMQEFHFSFHIRFHFHFLLSIIMPRQNCVQIQFSNTSRLKPAARASGHARVKVHHNYAGVRVSVTVLAKDREHRKVSSCT